MRCLFFALLLVSVISCTSRDVKVACVGDSITEGYGIKWQSDNSYPALLDSVLDNGYEVMNFGRSSTTAMYDGDFPYWSAKEFRNLIAYRPDIVIIKLGTNDSKKYQWNIDKFEKSYQALIDTLNLIESKPQIKLCLPVPVIETRWDIADSVVSGFVIPSIKKIANNNGLEIIDLNTPFLGHDELFLKDGIHPNREGAKKMAEIIAPYIK